LNILWFRRDLRIEDNALLSIGGKVLPVFIFDANILDSLNSKDKRVSFIYETVLSLQKKLQSIGLDLYIFHGDPVAIFQSLKAYGAKKIYAAVDYDNYALKRDRAVAKVLPLQRIQDCFIFEPDEVLKDDQTPYLVFTPFYNKAKNLYTPAHAGRFKRASHILGACQQMNPSLQQIGFEKAQFIHKSPLACLEEFAQKLPLYQKRRDFLSVDATSNLGIHLRFGTISIREVLRFLIEQKKRGVDTQPFFRQLIFRDFYAYLLYHFPTLEYHDYKPLVEYRFDQTYYDAFINARTGVPIIDAALTELITTGYMHNRARMITASFFTKHLLLPWQEGEAFFAKYLMDFEKSSNVLSWQWAAGTGIDPQPYFRIFNPYTQGQKFDTDALYIKKHLPFLADIEPKKLHDEKFLFQTDIKGYPKPIVVHKQARQRALDAKF